MNLEREIHNAFNILPVNIVTDEFIEENPNLMEIGSEFEESEYIPSYMLWCVRKKTDTGSLVFDFTINALAEYGRMKGEKTFKSKCSPVQKSVIREFLLWCSGVVVGCNENQIERTLRRWS